MSHTLRLCFCVISVPLSPQHTLHYAHIGTYYTSVNTRLACRHTEKSTHTGVHAHTHTLGSQGVCVGQGRQPWLCQREWGQTDRWGVKGVGATEINELKLSWVCVNMCVCVAPTAETLCRAKLSLWRMDSFNGERLFPLWLALGWMGFGWISLSLTHLTYTHTHTHTHKHTLTQQAAPPVQCGESQKVSFYRNPPLSDILT